MKGSVHLQASRCLTEQHQATCNEELDYKDSRWKWEEGDMRWRPRNISLARELNKGRLLHHFSPPQRSQTLASSALNYISWIISPSWFGHADVTFENRWTLATICFSFPFFLLSLWHCSGRGESRWMFLTKVIVPTRYHLDVQKYCSWEHSWETVFPVFLLVMSEPSDGSSYFFWSNLTWKYSWNISSKKQSFSRKCFVDNFETSKSWINTDELKLEQTKTTKYAERHSFVSNKSFWTQIATCYQ